MERSLVLVKPDGIHRRLAGSVLGRLEGLGLKILALKMLHMSDELARRHYDVHSSKPFFASLVDYITSSPIVAVVFEGDNAVEVIRKAMGATDPAKAEKGTIRGDFGLDIEHNTVHGSDSPENAGREIDIFFDKDEIFSY